MSEFLTSPYYITNILLCMIYPTVKYIGMTSPSLLNKDSWGYSREQTLVTGIVTILIIRFLKYYSNLKKFINEIIFYLKLGNILSFYFIDMRLLCWYIFLSVVGHILFKQPVYSGKTKMIYIPSKEIFDELLKLKNKLFKGKDFYIFAVFYSTSSEDNIYVRLF
jgi:hypothetical protein